MRQLEYAVALADHGHFGEAARDSFVSQPALSAQIRELEAKLGVDLFERQISGTTLTAAGAEVVARAREILGAVTELAQLAAAHSGTIAGELRLAAIPTLAPYLLPTVVDAFRARWPDSTVVLEELRSDELLSALESGDIDIGLFATPYDVGRVHVEPLAWETFALAVPEQHPLAEGDEALPTGVLADLQVLLLPQGHCLGDHAQGVCDVAGNTEYSRVAAGSIATLVRMVAAGMGVTLLPESAELIEARTGSGIKLRRFAEPAPGRTVALVWRDSDPRRDLFTSVADDLSGLKLS